MAVYSYISILYRAVPGYTLLPFALGSRCLIKNELSSQFYGWTFQSHTIFVTRNSNKGSLFGQITMLTVITEQLHVYMNFMLGMQAWFCSELTRAIFDETNIVYTNIRRVS